MMKKIIILILALCVFAGCSATEQSTAAPSSSEPTEQVNQTEVNSSGYDITFSDNDLDSSYSESGATLITLKDNACSVSGNGAVADKNTVTVTGTNTCIVTGTLNDGQLVVEIPASEKVQIVLKNASITCSDGPAIYIKQAEKVFLTLDGENFIADGSTYSDAYTEENAGAALYSKEDIAINGQGTLTVNGNYRHGITSKDDLVITGGIIAVDAVEQGLHGKDCVKICNASLNITSGTDGIQSDNTEDPQSRGYIYIESGTFNITSGNDGIQAENYFKIAGGDFNIVTGEGSAVSSNNPGWGMMMQQSNSETQESMKAIKCASLLEIIGGTFNIDSEDDAVHSNDDVSVSNAVMNLSSGDDGIHADSELTIYSGTVTVSKSYEGLEGNSIKILDGEISVTASDDGFNSAGGNDASGLNRPGENPFAADETCDITVEGGNIYINAAGDGIDSNGSLNILGGIIILHGPEDGANGALDYAATAGITGGEFVAFGSSQMALNFNDSTSQPAVMYSLSQSYQGGTEVALLNENGETVLEAVSEKSFNSVILSSSKLESEKTYTILVNGEEIDTVTFTQNIVSGGTGGGMGGMQGGMGGGMQGGMMNPNRGDMQLPDGDMQLPEDDMQMPDRGGMGGGMQGGMGGMMTTQ